MMDFTPLEYLPSYPKKSKWLWKWDCTFADGGYWRPMNYEAETIHLIKTYGVVKDNIRRFKP